VFKRLSSRGFTLIELLVVIVIIAILMAIAIPAYLAQQTKAQDQKTKQYLNYAYRDIRSALPEANNVFQQSTSLVNVVSASEPQLTLASGNCGIGLLNSTPNTLIVDNATTANSLSLCSKSQSGNLWRLTSTPSGAHQLLDGSAIPLFFAGNEITDASRALGVQGDGLTNDSSTGVWQGTTNTMQNSAATTNMANWAASADTASGAAATAVRVTGVGPFGTAIKYNVSSQGGWGAYVANNYFSYAAPFDTAQKYTLSFWAWTDTSLANFIAQIARTDSTNFVMNGTLFAPTSTPTRYSITFTPLIAGVNPSVMFLSTGPAYTGNLYVTGVQLEQSPIETPYVQSVATPGVRAAGDVSAPSSVLDTTQFWVAYRLRAGFSSNASITGRNFFAWGNNSNARTYAYYPNGGGNNYFDCGFTPNGSSFYEVSRSAKNAVALTPGTYSTVICSWSSSGGNTTVKTSVNGQTFDSASFPSSLPTITAPRFEIGAQLNGGSNTQWDGDIIWMATGTGPVSDADASTINGFGNNDPKRSSFPSSAVPTFVWDGAGTNGSLK
jgi:type IV pilus assembly protein PilA